MWSRPSPRVCAAAMLIRRLSLTASWPKYCSSRRGRSVGSTAWSSTDGARASGPRPAQYLDGLERIAPVIGVEVPPAPVWGDSRVEHKRVVHLAGYDIGLVHDFILPGTSDIMPGTMERYPAEREIAPLVERFFGEPV